MSQILVVDDEPAIREFVRAFLEDEGYSVTVGRDGSEALHRIHALRPDLVLMDIMMPGLDGLEVVRQLHGHPTHSAIPVILMSAASRWDHAVDGPIQFLSKPFDLDRLLTMIGTALQQRGDRAFGPTAMASEPPSALRTSSDMIWMAEPSLATNLN